MAQGHLFALRAVSRLPRRARRDTRSDAAQCERRARGHPAAVHHATAQRRRGADRLAGARRSGPHGGPSGPRGLTGARGLGAVLDDVSVFARVTPTHKTRIVAAYQAGGRAVAMTGDGANDAPAIGLADVGVALGERATAAARQTADVVVPDGRIETLIDAV